MRKKLTITYIFILICTVLILGGIFFSDLNLSWKNGSSNDSVHIWDNYTINGSEDSVVLEGGLCDYSDTHAVIAFFSTHLDFEVYADNTLLYRYPQHNNNNFFSATSGYAWHFIELPANACRLHMNISTPYGAINGRIPTFYIGNTTSIISLILYEDLPTFIICIMLLCLGIIMVVYWIIVHKRVAILPTICYLGLSAALLSLWTLSQNRFTALMLNNNLVTVYASFHIFMLLPLPVMLFIKSYYEDDKSKLWKVIFTIIVLQNIICIALQYLKILDFMHTLWTSFALIGFCVISVLVYSFHLYRKGYNKQKIIFHMISLLVFFIFSSIDILVYLISGWSNSILGRIGIVLYIIILGYDTIKESAKLMQMGEQATAYHHLAFSDNMTGLGNRTAYNHDFSHYNITPDGVAIIDFDLNCLKQVNDQHGHQAGDRYIMLAADMIDRNFHALGKTYRIGGDEFVVIVTDCENITFEPYFDALHNDMEKYNKKTNQFHIHIAYGMAIYSSTMDRSLEDTYGRADKAMYQNKKRLKEKAASN